LMFSILGIELKMGSLDSAALTYLSLVPMLPRLLRPNCARCSLCDHVSLVP
jgi:hypothetical protein